MYFLKIAWVLRIRVAALFILSVPLSAQTDPLGLWAIYFGTYEVAPKWVVFTDVQQRINPEPQQQIQTMLRIGLQRTINDHQSVMLGAAGIPTQIANQDLRFEFRVFEQFMSTHQWQRATLRHRVRVEQRLMGSELAHRLRYFVQLNTPIYRGEQGTRVPYVSVYNELFVQPGADGLFDRNRFFAGIGYPFSRYMRMEFGAMAQTTQTATSVQWNVLLYHNIPFGHSE